jgi:hypothetical protein
VGEILHVDTSNVRVMPPWAMQFLGTVMDVMAEFTGVMPLITSEMAQLLTQDSASLVEECCLFLLHSNNTKNMLQV